MPACAVVSFRLGGNDGVSVVAARWRRILERLGWHVFTVAGEGAADRIIPGLGIGAPLPPASGRVEEALADADLALVENLCSLPLNLPASRVVAAALAGRQAILHHHDLPWQRERFAHLTELPPHDERWRHVTINSFSARQLAERGIAASVIYNPFDVDALPGNRLRTRQGRGVAPAAELLAVHPVRAIARKNVPLALEVCETLGATYWLTGPAEEGYGPALEAVLDRATCRVLRGTLANDADLYAAADLVLLTSTQEGFGNPPVEAAIWRKPAVVSNNPASEELRALGFRWFYPHETDGIRNHLAAQEPEAQEMLDHNQSVAKQHLSMEAACRQLAHLLNEMGLPANR